jgi:ketosteroid isomerase-like protein
MTVARLVCRSCGATWLSEPAALLIERHDGKCLRCDGRVESGSENEATLRRYLDAINAHDEDAMAATLDPDVKVYPAPHWAAIGRLPPAMHGIPAAIEAFRSVRQGVSHWLFTLEWIEEHPDGRLVCAGSYRMVNKDGDSETRAFFWAFRMRHRRLVELRDFERPQDARQSLELTEP